MIWSMFWKKQIRWVSMRHRSGRFLSEKSIAIGIFHCFFSSSYFIHFFRWWIQNCLNCPRPIHMVIIAIRATVIVLAEITSTEAIMIAVHSGTMRMAIVRMVLPMEMPLGHVSPTMTVRHVSRITMANHVSATTTLHRAFQTMMAPHVFQPMAPHVFQIA